MGILWRKCKPNKTGENPVEEKRRRGEASMERSGNRIWRGGAILAHSQSCALRGERVVLPGVVVLQGVVVLPGAVVLEDVVILEDAVVLEEVVVVEEVVIVEDVVVLEEVVALEEEVELDEVLVLGDVVALEDVVIRREIDVLPGGGEFLLFHRRRHHQVELGGCVSVSETSL